MSQDYKTTVWYEYLDVPMQRLVRVSMELMERESGLANGYADYSFVVFPLAKAYEGFLKKFLFEVKLIERYQLEGRHFRIGRSLNPDLPKKYRDEEWLFDDLEDFCRRCGDEGLARDIWQAWSEGRNKLFHYFANHEDWIDLGEARRRMEMLVGAMDGVVKCRVG